MMRRTILFTLLCLLVMPLLGQPYLPTRAMMYNQGPNPYLGPEGVEHVEIWRYVPGARFESGWDVKIEDREYDEQRRLVAWTRYQTVAGNLIWRKEFSYGPDGRRKTERTYRAIEDSDVKLTYREGKAKGQELVNPSGKVVATLAPTASGGLVYTENPGQAQARAYVYDAEGKSLEMTDQAANQLLTYAYDDKGNMLSLTQTTGKVKSVTQYENIYNDAGQLIQQTEVFAGKKLSRKFNYNENGQLTEKRDQFGVPIEYRYYMPDGNISNMLITDPEGHPLEVIRYSYLNYHR